MLCGTVWRLILSAQMTALTGSSRQPRAKIIMHLASTPCGISSLTRYVYYILSCLNCFWSESWLLLGQCVFCLQLIAVRDKFTLWYYLPGIFLGLPRLHWPEVVPWVTSFSKQLPSFLSICPKSERAFFSWFIVICTQFTLCWLVLYGSWLAVEAIII